MLHSVAGFIGRNDYISHVSCANIVCFDCEIVEIEIGVDCRFAPAVDKVDYEPDRFIFFQGLTELGARHGEPCSLRQLQSVSSFHDTPGTDANERKGGDSVGEVGIWDKSFEIDHALLTFVFLAFGLFFDALALIAHSPACATVIPYSAYRWTASLLSLALGIALLGTAFNRML